MVTRALFQILFLTLVATPSFATLEDEFNRLKKSDVDFNNFGQVCEAVAEHNYLTHFAKPQFEVVNGVAYGDQDGTLGELDIVVLESATQAVVAIGEVKCWRDSKSALSMANEQKQRLLEALRSGDPLFFKGLHTKRDYKVEQFDHNPAFHTVGPLGSKTYGFDVELDYTLTELMDLRERLIKCKSNRRCK